MYEIQYLHINTKGNLYFALLHSCLLYIWYASVLIHAQNRKPVGLTSFQRPYNVVLTSCTTEMVVIIGDVIRVGKTVKK